MASVLIIDDDKGICTTLSRIVKRSGHDAACAHTLQQGMDETLNANFDVVFLDVNLPDGSGLKLLKEITKTPSKPEVIIITGKGSADGAELAIKNGAWDYIQKPSSVKEMTLPLVRALQYREEKLAHKQMPVLRTDGIIGSSRQLQVCLDRLAQAASSNGNVIITGETGTGKELFSRAIHVNSLRCKGPYVIVDCTAIPEPLVESTLFGHVREPSPARPMMPQALSNKLMVAHSCWTKSENYPFLFKKSFSGCCRKDGFGQSGVKGR